MKFEIPKEDILKLYNFMTEHEKDCDVKYGGAIGGKYTYCFTPTGLGTIIKINCVCGKVFDITDYESW